MRTRDRITNEKDRQAEGMRTIGNRSDENEVLFTKGLGVRLVTLLLLSL